MLDTIRRKRGMLVIGSIILLLLVGLYLWRTQQTSAQSPVQVIPPTAFLSEQFGEPVFGVFEGITPCSGVKRPLPQIPEDTNCEQMIWKLTFNQDPVTGNPTTYELVSSYGLSEQNTRGLQDGGTALNLAGKWTKTQGANANPKAEVYELNPDDPQEAIYFIKMDENILHVLAQDKSMMVGNGGWSYTLNRTDKRLVSEASATDPISPTIPSELINSEMSSPSQFEGRIPCDENIRALLDITASGCNRVKMALTLYLDAETGTPSTYELATVHVGTGNTRFITEGTWTILQGTAADPEAIVYRLDQKEPLAPLFLLKADENNLFFLASDFNLMIGDAFMSYTLSRTHEQ